MKITDGKRTVEINIMTWNGAGCGPDWAGEYFNAGALPYDEEKDAYFKPIRLSFDFARRVPYGACKAPAGDLAGSSGLVLACGPCRIARTCAGIICRAPESMARSSRRSIWQASNKPNGAALR